MYNLHVTLPQSVPTPAANITAFSGDQVVDIADPTAIGRIPNIDIKGTRPMICLITLLTNLDK